MRQLDLDLLDSSVRIGRSSYADGDTLRTLFAEFEYVGDSKQESVAEIAGWIGWSILDDDLTDAGDEIGQDAAQLAATADDIIESLPEKYIDTALLIDRMHVNPAWRGNRLSGTLITHLMALLRLDPATTVVVLQPEPQKPSGGPYDDGVKRDEAMARLHAAYRDSGLEPWLETGVWWRPL